MKYRDGQIARLGDRAHLWDAAEGAVVCSLDTDEFSAQYPNDPWGYLRQSALMHSAQTGLIHYLEPQATFQLLKRGRQDGGEPVL
jgi:hypothetical protein